MGVGVIETNKIQMDGDKFYIGNLKDKDVICFGGGTFYGKLETAKNSSNDMILYENDGYYVEFDQ